MKKINNEPITTEAADKVTFFYFIAVVNVMMISLSLLKIMNFMKISSRFGLIISVVF